MLRNDNDFFINNMSCRFKLHVTSNGTKRSSSLIDIHEKSVIQLVLSLVSSLLRCDAATVIPSMITMINREMKTGTS